MISYATGIFLLQMSAYASIIPMIMYGDWWHYLIAIFVYFLNGCLGMIMGYHRLITHRNFKCPLWFEKFITICATIGLTGPAIDWVAIHKAHHRYADTEKDPHSPDYLGRFRVHFLTMYTKVETKFAGSLLKNQFYRFQRKYYFLINAIYAIVLYLLDPFAIVYAWLFPAAMVIGFGTAILSLSHRDKSAHNDFWLAMLTWGEAFHEEHHSDPSRARLHKWDITGIIIETFFEVERRFKHNDDKSKSLV
jgi:stearoyl-CoA desaturase (delta-9 desaturase)